MPPQAPPQTPRPLDSETRAFLLSPPRADWSLQGKANFRSRAAIAPDAALARAEWERLADAIVAAGGEVVVMPADPARNLTGMIYTAEAGEFFRTATGEPGFLLPNMAAAHRRKEAAWIAGFVEEMGFVTRRVDAVWEAQGDAIRGRSADEIIHTFGVGPDARTDRAAYQEVADLLSPRHVQIRFVADPWFHGNTFMNVYRSPNSDDHLLVVCPEALPDQEYDKLRAFLPDAEVVEITAEQSLGYDTNSLQVNETVIAPTSLSEHTASALANLGLSVERLDLGELFMKGGGAPVCLTNRLWGVRDDEIPDRVRWSKIGGLDAVLEKDYD